ncbi:hypothetical protein V6N11_021891 [Hibiscus sabdariffa]|uniref:Uncharacterized protein n=1 Tax=Hibiscus sabdariffa TaxID=183260 RepID=A0ABR2TIJ1_9ROSI
MLPWDTKPNVDLGHLLALIRQLAKTMTWLATLPRGLDVSFEASLGRGSSSSPFYNVGMDEPEVPVGFELVMDDVRGKIGGTYGVWALLALGCDNYLPWRLKEKDAIDGGVGGRRCSSREDVEDIHEGTNGFGDFGCFRKLMWCSQDIIRSDVVVNWRLRVFVLSSLWDGGSSSAGDCCQNDKLYEANMRVVAKDQELFEANWMITSMAKKTKALRRQTVDACNGRTRAET